MEINTNTIRSSLKNFFLLFSTLFIFNPQLYSCNLLEKKFIYVYTNIIQEHFFYVKENPNGRQSSNRR